MPLERARLRADELLRGSHTQDALSRWVNHLLIGLILATAVAFMLETVDPIRERYGSWLVGFEGVAVIMFTLEYIGRVWTAPEEPRFAHPVTGRLRWMITPLAIVDLLAIVPFYLGAYLPYDLILLRLLRLFRVIRLAKISRYSRSLQTMARVVRRQRQELFMAFATVLMLMVLAAWGMWLIESSVQPDAFSSVPATMWWAVITLTTVGYGDVVPATTLGRILAGVIALLGVAFLALPAGILAGGFVEELTEQTPPQDRVGETDDACPHCGGPLPHDEAP